MQSGRCEAMSHREPDHSSLQTVLSSIYLTMHLCSYESLPSLAALPVHSMYVGSLVGWLSFTSSQHPCSYQDGFRVVTVHTHGNYRQTSLSRPAMGPILSGPFSEVVG